MPFWKPDCGFSEMLQNRLRFQNLGKPRTAGLCGRAAGACDCGLLSCAFIERANKGRNPTKRGMAGRETSIPKGSVSHCRSRMHRAFSHVTHKRRNVRFKGLRRVHTPPQPITAHTAAHRAKRWAFSPSATAWLCAVSEIATERTAGESGCTPYGVCPLSPASRPRWVAQPGRCCFRSRECFSLAVPAFVPTASSPAPAAVPVPLETAVRSRGDSCRSAVDSIPPSSAAEHPARLR